MTRSGHSKLLAIAVLIGLVIALATWWITGALNACRDPATTLKFSEANGCIEFWFNRYQGVVSALIAAIVAFIVVQPVYRQLRETQRQTAAAAQAVVHNLILQVDEELGLLDRIEIQSRSVGYVVDKRDPADRSRFTEGEREYGMMAISFDSTLAAVARIGERRNDSELDQIRRTTFLAECGDEVRKFEVGLRHWMTAGHGPLEPPTASDLQVSRDANRAIVDVSRNYRDWLLQTRSGLLDRLAKLRETFVVH